MRKQAMVRRSVLPWKPWLAPLLIVAALVGAPDVAAQAPQTKSGRVDTIATGELAVLYNPATPPTSFIRDGQPTGMAIDLITEAARRIGVKPVFKAHADVAGALPAISNGQYDVAALGLMRTPEREAVVDFSGPWYYGWFPLVVDTKSGIKDYADLRGKIVGATKGSIQERWLTENQKEAKLMAFPNEVSMITALNAGSVDAILMGSAQLEETLKRYPHFAAIARTPTPYPNAFPLRKGNASLKKALDDALAAMAADGTYLKIFDKWHPGDPLPEPLYKDYPALAQQRKPGVPAPK
jgi:polar amino acid transport system substrate-binding protein